MKNVFKFKRSELEIEGAVNYFGVTFLTNFGPWKAGDKAEYMSLQVDGENSHSDVIILTEWSEDGRELKVGKATLQPLGE